METVPADIVSLYKALLSQNGIPDKSHYHYLKWLGYYLDFCKKYNFENVNPQSLPKYIGNLKEKRQPEASQAQAKAAIRIYYRFVQSQSAFSKKEAIKKPDYQETAKEHQQPFLEPAASWHHKPDSDMGNSTPRTDDPKTNKEKWNTAFTSLSNEIKVRRYSPKSLKSYATWAHK